MAPMRGVTTCTYRRVFEHHFCGIDRAISPFIPTVSADRIKPKLLKDILPENNGSLPLIPQLISRNADDMLRMLSACFDLGYTEANWNLGCPHKQVTKKMRGSGLLPHPETILSILDTVCAAMPGKLSVKVRLGAEGSEDLFALLPQLDSYPLTEIIIHPRTATQMYNGQADFDAFESCLPLTRHTLCYNGDIFTPEIFQTLQKRFPTINRWMLGRGLIRNPFLAQKLSGEEAASSPAEKKHGVQLFHDDLYAQYSDILYGPVSILGKMKEFWTYLSCSFENTHRVFKRIKKTHTLPTYEAVVREIFNEEKWHPQTHNE